MDSHLNGIITRLEASNGPDREIDTDIAVAILNVERVGCGLVSHPSPNSGAVGCSDYTASIDAALTLVPELNDRLRPLQINFGVSESGKFWGCTINNWQWGTINGGRCATPAIALCIAALKARVALSGSQSEQRK